MSLEAFAWMIGGFRDEVEMELVKDKGISPPRMKPLTDFPEVDRVEVSRTLGESFPLGTRFMARVKVCQKHNRDGTSLGSPYLKAYRVGVVVSSISDKGFVAKLDPTGVDGRKYYYIYK